MREAVGDAAMLAMWPLIRPSMEVTSSSRRAAGVSCCRSSSQSRMASYRCQTT
jgi:hypothetical protein